MSRDEGCNYGAVLAWLLAGRGETEEEKAILGIFIRKSFSDSVIFSMHKLNSRRINEMEILINLL